jgi:hypothetical protein
LVIEKKGEPMDNTQAHAMLQEFLQEHPEELPWLDVATAPGETEPGPWFPPETSKKFLRWMVAKGYGDPQETEDLIGAIDRSEAERVAHRAGLCRPETCGWCRRDA